MADDEQSMQREKSTNLIAYGSTIIETKGLDTVRCYSKEQPHTLLFFIVDRNVQPLLRFCACVDMGIVRLSPDVHQVTMEQHGFSTQILTQYKYVFSNELGELPVTYSMTLNPNIQPVA